MRSRKKGATGRRNKSEGGGISSREIHKSGEEIPNSLAHLCISSGELYISLRGIGKSGKEIGISLAHLPNSSRKTHPSPVDFWAAWSAFGNATGVVCALNSRSEIARLARSNSFAAHLRQALRR